MYPILPHIGPIPIYSFGLMVTLGFAAGLWLAYRLAKSDGLPAAALLDAGAWILIASILGARLLFVLLNWSQFAGHWGEMLRTWHGGMSFHGGLAGGILAGVIFAWRRRLPFWALAQETGLSINLHIGSGGSQGIAGASITYSGHSTMFALAEGSTRGISANTQVMATMLFSQILERFPRMKLVSSESGIGWVPYLLEVADHQWERQKLWREGMSIKPSEYFHRQCYANFWFEEVGIKMREYIGIDNIMWESDYPHPTCTYPNSQEYIAKVTQELTPEERQKILVDNAVRVFNLD